MSTPPDATPVAMSPDAISRRTPIRLLLADDHPVVRAGLRALLERQPGLHVVGEAADGTEAIALARTLRPDLLLCDLRMGEGPDGVAVAATLAGETAVLILTTYDHDIDITRAVEAGAAGYLLKDAPVDQVVAAIRTAASGGRVLSDEQEHRVIATMRARRVAMSDRELDVLRQVAAGASNREAARALFLSEATVKTHLAHSYAKLGVDNRTAAVARARDLGLIDD